MVGTILTIIASSLTLILGLLAILTRKRAEKNKAIDEAQKMIEEGLENGDTSLITAGFTRLRNIR
jgi:hypothetical protein